MAVGDLGDVAAALAPRPLWLEGLVDGLNRRVTAATLVTAYGPAKLAYQSAGAGQRLYLSAEPHPSAAVAQWLRRGLGP